MLIRTVAAITIYSRFLREVACRNFIFLIYKQRIFDNEQRKEINLLFTYDFPSAKYNARERPFMIFKCM